MKKRLEFSEGGSHKFWEVEVASAVMTVTFGRIGTSGQSKPKSFGSEAEALKEAEKLIAEKTKKGYAESGAAPVDASPSPSSKASSASSDATLPTALRELIGGKCYRTHEEEEEDVVVFDWWALPAAFRDEMISDLFGDCAVPGDYPALIGPSERGIEWISRACVPFALGGVQSGPDTLGPDGGVPQFDRLLLIDASGAAYAIEVDGTAIPAKEPEKIAKSWEKLKIKKRAPVKPVVAGALPKVKATKHVRLVGSFGAFVPPQRDTAMVRGIDLSADASIAALAVRGEEADAGVRVHRVGTGELVRYHAGPHGAVAISPDGSRVISTDRGYDTRVTQIGTCWDVATGETLWRKTLQHGDGMPGLRVSPAGDQVFVSSQGHGIRAYSLDGELAWEDPIAKGQFDNHAVAMAFSPAGALITAGVDGVIRIWDGRAGKVLRKISSGNPINGLVVLPGGERIVSHGSHATAIWDVASGKLVKELRTWERGRLAGEIALSPAGLIVGCTIDGKIDIWALDGAVVDRIDLKGKVGAWCLAPCPGGVLVGTGGDCALRFELTA